MDALIESGLSDKAKKYGAHRSVRTALSAPKAAGLLRGESRDAGENLPFEELEGRAAAGGDVAHLGRLAALLTALTESPPPMIEVPPFALTVATASQTP